MRRRKGISAALLAAAFAAGPVQAQVPLSDLTFVPACTQVTGDVDVVTAALGKAGWKVASKLSDAMVEDIAWANSAYYFGGDTGGASLAQVLDIQRKSARGLARKADIPRSRTRVLTRGDDTLVLALRTSVLGEIELECRVTAKTDSMAALRGALGETGAYPAYAPLDDIAVNDGKITITLLNAARLAGFDAPDAIIFTRATQGTKG
ncbi:hypothetical protein [Rhodalgimonas zhirmunskyi]|uniref:Uncharacterized protein n=1 Tax=Rhodalgimonas zhirmunskyi TaxID=2964767 RepID=A0AAJ1UEZ2_9RHOB|nr:hypothetical protein [Rhodoalgimonas zhirmunskyi]MDQ2094712.1 hypothetical protein [Rhodoalgimonas zhirmunskyi]